MNGLAFFDTNVLVYAGDASSPELAQRKVEVLARARVVRFEPGDVIAAIELRRLTRISFWDASIVHAARSAGVQALYSDDLQPGAVLGGVRAVNPFAA
jgi:predicted nucleic acid-binding protein